MNSTYNLTPIIIEQFASKYLNDITAIKESDDRKDQIVKSQQFWKAHHKVDYSTYLYLMREYVNDNLCATPYCFSPIWEDHDESRPILDQLMCEGILTTAGQRSIENKQRSFIAFEMPIDEDDINAAIGLLQMLHDKGLNVSASICKYDQSEDDCEYEEEMDYSVLFTEFRNIILFQSDARMIYNTNAPTLEVTIPSDEVLVSRSGTWCHLDSPNLFDHNIDHVIYPTTMIMSVSMFNQNWDMLQADEVLLETIREMKN